MAYRKVIIGIDLNIREPQISFYDLAIKKTRSMLMKIGNAQVELKELFEKMEEHTTEETATVLAGILKEVFVTVGISDIKREIIGMMITVPQLSKKMVDVLRIVFDLLQLPKSKSYMQEYKESLFHYMMYQKQEIWNHNVSCLEIYDETKVRFYTLALNRMTKPITAAVTVTELGEISTIPEQRDQDLANVVRTALAKGIFSSIFVTGEKLDDSWAKESKRALVKSGRAAFTEGFLFARGACYSAREKADEKRISGISYIGGTIVNENIGMNMQVGERTAYYPLITAGTHWYNAQHDCEFILGDQKRIVFVISNAQDGGRRLHKLELNELPDRPERTTRIHLHLEYESGSRCVITAEDMGFGELFPSSKLKWKEILEGAK